MSSLIPARRRAEDFQALVEGDRPPGGASPYADLLTLVGGLRTLEAPVPRAVVVADLRAALLVEADEVLLPQASGTTGASNPAPTRRPRSDRPRGRRRLAVALAALSFVGATASVAVAAQHALPGDALYPVKRALENVQTGLSAGDSRTREILDNAGARLDEVDQLIRRGDASDEPQIRSTLEDFSGQAQEGGDRALSSGEDAQVRALRDFTAASMAKLDSLSTIAPQQLRPDLAAAAQVVAALDARAAVQCPTCGGPTLDLPPALAALVPGATASLPPTALTGANPTGAPGTGSTSGPAGGPSGAPTAATSGQPGQSTGATQPGPTPGGPVSTPQPGQSSPAGPVQQPTGDLLGSDGPLPSLPPATVLDPITSPLASTIDGVLPGAGGLLGGG